MAQPELIITKDGSHTFYISALNEHYHSHFGAVQESKFVFIEAGFNSCSKKEMAIFEVGFGTGLNAWLTAIEAQKQQKKVVYHSIEKFPLDYSTIRQLNYPGFCEKKFSPLFYQIHRAEWDKQEQINEYFSLFKIKADWENYNFKNDFNLIYFDAFAPEVQPEMWSEAVFAKLYQAINLGGFLVTYSCKGIIKRRLSNTGFIWEKLPGPPGKREILRAQKQ